jgi:hypothetical protein
MKPSLKYSGVAAVVPVEVEEATVGGEVVAEAEAMGVTRMGMPAAEEVS